MLCMTSVIFSEVIARVRHYGTGVRTQQHQQQRTLRVNSENAMPHCRHVPESLLGSQFAFGALVSIQTRSVHIRTQVGR